MAPRTLVMQCCKYAGHISVTSSRRLGWTPAKWNHSIPCCSISATTLKYSILWWFSNKLNDTEKFKTMKTRGVGRSTGNTGKTSQQYPSGVFLQNAKVPPHTSQCTRIWSTPCTTHWNRTEVVQHKAKYWYVCDMCVWIYLFADAFSWKRYVRSLSLRWN